jgi:hypothetical protein
MLSVFLRIAIPELAFPFVVAAAPRQAEPDRWQIGSQCGSVPSSKVRVRSRAQDGVSSEAIGPPTRVVLKSGETGKHIFQVAGAWDEC